MIINVDIDIFFFTFFVGFFDKSKVEMNSIYLKYIYIFCNYVNVLTFYQFNASFLYKKSYWPQNFEWLCVCVSTIQY